MLLVAYCSRSNSIEIGDLGSKVKVIVSLYPFFLHNSLLSFLLWISAVLCPIKMKFSLSLRYALSRFVFEFDKIRMGDNVIVTSFKFSANNCLYFKFYWTYKLYSLLGFNVQLHKVHFWLEWKWHWHKLKVTDHKKWFSGHISQTITFTDIIPGTKAKNNKRYATCTFVEDKVGSQDWRFAS